MTELTNERNVPELMPCPFCGCAGIQMQSLPLGGVRHTIKCEDCPGRAEFYSSSREQAIAAWNRRAAPVAEGVELPPKQSIADFTRFHVLLGRWMAQREYYQDDAASPVQEAWRALIAYIDAKLTEARRSREIAELLNNPSYGQPDLYSRLHTAMTDELALADGFGKRSEWFMAARSLLDYLESRAAAPSPDKDSQNG